MALTGPILEQKRTGAWAFTRQVSSGIWNFVACGSGPALLAVYGWATGRTQPAWLFATVVALGSFIAGFRMWSEERIDRNGVIAEAMKLDAEVNRLARPFFVSEVEVAIEEDPQRPDWIKIYMNLVIRNQGAESTIDRWRIVVLPPSGTPYLEDRRSLNAAQRGPHNLMSGNLLNDREIIPRGGTKEGWLLYEGPQARLGVSKNQMPVVEVSFQDVHDHEYHFVSRPGFEKQMEDIRMGRFR
jgi:hypothetical protein